MAGKGGRGSREGQGECGGVLETREGLVDDGYRYGPFRRAI
jgi:hypothetical protein